MGARATSKNKVVILALQPGGIGSLQSFLGLLESYKFGLCWARIGKPLKNCSKSREPTTVKNHEKKGDAGSSGIALYKRRAPTTSETPTTSGNQQVQGHQQLDNSLAGMPETTVETPRTKKRFQQTVWVTTTAGTPVGAAMAPKTSAKAGQTAAETTNRMRKVLDTCNYRNADNSGHQQKQWRQQKHKRQQQFNWNANKSRKSQHQQKRQQHQKRQQLHNHHGSSQNTH